MRPRGLAVAAAAAVLLAASAGGVVRAEPPPVVVVIKAARLIDGRGGAPLVPAMVRVNGDRIAEVGPRVAIPAGARVVDLGEATLLPGLIDLHTHLTDRFGVHWEQALVPPRPARPRCGARPTRAPP
jgi:adenine deaminase